MERKYRNQKKTILVLSIIAVLLIAVITYQQIRITNVKAEQDEYWEEQHALKEQELVDAKADYESRDLENTEDELKEENKYWKDYAKDIVKAYENDGDIEAVIAEYEGAADDEAAADDTAATDDTAAADDKSDDKTDDKSDDEE